MGEPKGTARGLGRLVVGQGRSAALRGTTIRQLLEENVSAGAIRRLLGGGTTFRGIRLPPLRGRRGGAVGRAGIEAMRAELARELAARARGRTRRGRGTRAQRRR